MLSVPITFGLDGLFGEFLFTCTSFWGYSGTYKTRVIVWFALPVYVAAIMVLVYERQKEMQRVCRVTWAHPFGVDGPSD